MWISFKTAIDPDMELQSTIFIRACQYDECSYDPLKVPVISDGVCPTKWALYGDFDLQQMPACEEDLGALLSISQNMTSNQ